MRDMLHSACQVGRRSDARAEKSPGAGRHECLRHVEVSSRYAGVDENFVLVLSASLPDSVAGGHSDFTDPKGPLLTPDFLDSRIPQRYQGEALAS